MLNTVKTLKIILLFLIMITAVRLYAQEDKIAEKNKGLESRPHLFGSIDERYLTSKETNSTFLKNIYLPPTYTDTLRKYPLMVLTDANFVMGIAQSTFDCLTLGMEIPEVIVVGISYPHSSELDWSRNRHRDMTPTHVEGYNPSGLADRFIAFIKNELFPYIENNYRVDNTDRCFYGHSFGGLLGSHILIEQPELFNRYIIGSPSYYWDNKEMTKRLSGKRFLSTDKVKAVYTYTGGKEGEMMLNPFKEFNGLLVNKISKNLKFHDQIYQDETHMSVTLAAFSTAVKFVYGK
jgi:predicted alpha/beta superfamily hydrolase